MPLLFRQGIGLWTIPWYRLIRVHPVQNSPQLRPCCSKTLVTNPFDSHSLNSITVENIKSSIRSWILKRVDKYAFKELAFEEQAAVFNRLLMVHCFEVFLYSKYPSARRSMFDCEVVLPALCSLIDRSLGNGVNTFVIGISQLNQLSALSKLVKDSEVDIIKELLQCRNDLLLDDFQEDSGYLVFDEDVVSEFIEPCKNIPYTISLLGPPASASAVYPLMMGRAKALQRLKKEGSNSVWPIYCYPLADICSKDAFNNIVNILNEPKFSAGGTIHLITNCEHDGIDDELNYSIESSSKLIKLLADMIKAPVVHVKAEEVDSVVYVMNMVSDFRANHKKDIIVNLMSASQPCPNKNVAPTGWIREFLVGGKDPLVAMYSKQLISSKILSKWEFDDRKENYLRKLVKDYSSSKVVNVKRKTTVLEKRETEPLTGLKDKSMSQMIGLLDTYHVMKKTPYTSEWIEESPKKSKSAASTFVGSRLDWKRCISLAYASLLQEGYHVQVSRSSRGTTSAIDDPGMLISDKLNCPGKFELQEGDISPFAMAGFQIGYSTTGNNKILAVWEVPEEMEPSVLHDIVNKYYNMGKLEPKLANNAVFIVPSYFRVPGTDGNFVQVSSQLSQVLDVCEDCDILTGFSDQLCNCNFVVSSSSTPANIFHLIRRHAISATPKPLIVFVPTNSDETSALEEMTGDTCFHPYVGDTSALKSNVSNVILCTGRIYHKLKEERSRRSMDDKIALGCLEQICPFPYNNLIVDMERYPRARIWWAQEEEFDDGCWNYVEARLFGLFGEERIIRFSGYYHPSDCCRTCCERMFSIFEHILDS